MTHPRHTNQKTQRHLDAMHHLMNRLQPFTPSEVARISLPIHISLESLKKGTGTYGDYADLADAINVSMVRAEQIGPQAIDMLGLARDAMMRTAQRFAKNGCWGFDGPAITEVSDAVDFYDQLLQMSSPKQMHDSLLEVKRRCNRIRANKAKAVAA
jgi:hypothetical protein